MDLIRGPHRDYDYFLDKLNELSASRNSWQWRNQNNYRAESEWSGIRCAFANHAIEMDSLTQVL